MIKCLCKENVQDRFTGEHYVAGKEYEFTEERAAEVTKSRYFEKVNATEFDVVDNSTSNDETVAKPKKSKRTAKNK